MIRTKDLRESDAWKPSVDERNSFDAGQYQPCELKGPARLVRLLAHGGKAPEGQSYNASRTDGPYWFAEADFLRMREEAKSQLSADLRSGETKETLDSRISWQMRFQLRDVLAVRRDWSPSFDYFIVLSIPEGKGVVALKGSVAGQPVYTNNFKGAARAKRGGIRLKGGLLQYVIHFDHPANAAAKAWIDPTLQPF
jgi:hypothetical protein